MSKNKETSSPALKRSWFQGLKAEFSKITWPTKHVLARKSFVTIVVSIILGLLIFGIDTLLEYGIKFIIGQVGEGMSDMVQNETTTNEAPTGERTPSSKEPRWYVAHTYSGYENKVKNDIEKTIENRKLHDQILEVAVPVQEVVEVKANGTKKVVPKKLFPGYVLINMYMNDVTWYIVRNTRGVTGFVGPESKPVPLTESEMRTMGITVKEVHLDVEVGDMIKVVTGAWEGNCGAIKSINEGKQTVTIEVDIFGRATSVEIGFTDIQKM